MRQWIGIVSELLEKHAHHRKHHTDGVRYGFFPRLGIFACGHCGAHSPMGASTDHCPSCGSSTSAAPVNSGAATPAAPAGGGGASG